MDKIKEINQGNFVFLLSFLALSFTIMNMAKGLGIILLLLLGLIVIATPYLYKGEKTVDYWQFLMVKMESFKKRIAKEKEKHLQRKKEHNEIQQRKREQAEKDLIEIKRQERQKYRNEVEKELAETHSMLKQQGISESAIAIALAEKRTNLLREYERRINGFEQQKTENSSQQDMNESSTSFELKKHGETLNTILFGIGFIFLLVASSILLKILDSTLTASVVGTGLIILSLITYLFYLPTFLYHASIEGKVLIFILNIIFGWTVIGWIGLLVIVNSKNKEHAFKEELLHHQRYK